MLKKIFTNTYTALFLYIPLLTHIGVFLCAKACVNIGNYVLVGIAIAFSCIVLELIFIFLGYFWGKKFINKLGFTAYFAIFALTIYNIFCMSLAFILSGGKQSGDIFIIIAFLSNIEFAYVNFIVVLIFTHSLISVFLLQIAVYGAFGGGVAFALWKKGLLHFNEPLKNLIFAALILTLGCIFYM
ncbi:MAG: hypothetical protein LBP40_08890 [Campylobacteraceae bacterium]|jgi:hypothetical protein|nr:hypothetical protein [Campylobacteraceae bacterium]